MLRTLQIFAAAAALALSSEALCQPVEDGIPEVVITATRLETPVDEVSGTILVISAEEIREKQARTVPEALAGLPGIDIVNQGGPGKATSVLLRGGNSRFTLVMIDGVEVNDPSNPERTFDFSHISTSDIERIEVLFGPQSTLYGSDAIGGVIHIITKKGARFPTLVVEAETGSFRTQRQHGAFRNQSGRVSYSLSADHVDTQGISAAAESDGNTEEDSYENLTVSGNLIWKAEGGTSLQLQLRSIDTTNELDHYGGPGGDDPNFTGDAKQLLGSARLTLFPMEFWETVLALSGNVHDRKDLNEPDPDRPFTMELSFKGSSERAELVNNFYLGDRSTFTLGFDSERETGESSFFSDEAGPYTSTLPRESATLTGVYLQEQYRDLSGITWTLGSRVDDHSEFGSETTWRAGVSVPLRDVARFRSVYGTGFRAPSIDQLFNPDYGNPDLGAERSRGWDVGLESTLAGNAEISLSYHLTRYDNLIAWFDADGDPSTWWDGSYENISNAETEGVDLALAGSMGNVSLGVNGSFLRAEDDQGEQLLRRPETRWGGRLKIRPTPATTLNVEAIWVGERKDWGDVTLDPYTLVNLAASWRLSHALEMFGRVQNLTDVQYEEADGYGTPGISAYVGMRAEM